MAGSSRQGQGQGNAQAKARMTHPRGAGRDEQKLGVVDGSARGDTGIVELLRDDLRVGEEEEGGGSTAALGHRADVGTLAPSPI